MSVERIVNMCPLLSVFDMPESLRFYCDLLGFHTVESAGPAGDMGWAWLRNADVDLMLNTQYELEDRPEEKDHAAVVAHGDTMLYFGSPDIDQLYERLHAAGTGVTPPFLTGYGYYAIEMKDPDGYCIVFQWEATSLPKS